MKNLKNKKGITLVEVIVVLVIMAILAGVLVGVYTGYIQKARERADIYEARAVLLAITTIYHEDYAAGNADEDMDASASTTWWGTAGTKVTTLCGVTDFTTGNVTNLTFVDGAVATLTYVTVGGNTYTYTPANGFVRATP